MKIIIVSGGGGHFAPALAVIEQLPKDVDFLLIGRKYGLDGDSAFSLEYKVAMERNLPFKTITTGRLQRTLTHHNILSAFKMPLGFWQALKILRGFQPDVVLSFGGYTAVPVVMAAALLKIPIVIHEQTHKAGLANKISSRFAKTICLTWESSLAFFPKDKSLVTGIPLRKAITNPEKSEILASLPKNKPLLFITGGSLGAHAINMLIHACLEQLLETFTIIHQSGDAREFKDFEKLEALKEQLSKEKRERYFVMKFIDPEELGAIMKSAALVVARAGANTTTELLYFQKRCILIPLPYAQENEQMENAKVLEEEGLALILQQETTTEKKLFEAIVEQYKKKESKEAVLTSIQKDSAEKLLAVVKKAVYD